MSFSNQLVILVGGRGTRLGEEAKSTPKPLMPISDGRVFLDYLLDAAIRQGFDDVVLLAGHLGDQVQQRYHNTRRHSARITVMVEPSPMGTGGAFRYALDRLAPTFVATNGDTLFDTNMRALDHTLQAQPDLQACLALRRVPDAGRYGSVTMDNGLIRTFREKDPLAQAAGLINGGIYALRRETISRLPEGVSSIEADLFPVLAAEGKLGGLESSGYFLDIGLPETLGIARRELPAQKRPALFLDRDGVINHDDGYVHKPEAFRWIDGAQAVIRRANDLGRAVIVVTNQAGVGRGYYSEGDVARLHHFVQTTLHEAGAFVDGFYHSPYHHEAEVERYRIPDHPDRKPNPGMILKAAADHNIDLAGSVMIGDMDTDMAAAAAAGVKGYKFEGGDLTHFVDAFKVF